MRIVVEKHLRLRGENLAWKRTKTTSSETPPLARRKLGKFGEEWGHGGNTSACAEKTPQILPNNQKDKKHLRLRGENPRMQKRSRSTLETPPLARRKPSSLARSSWRRNTSACAEKTFVERMALFTSRKHLRLRGENLLLQHPKYTLIETPPLARRKPPLIQEPKKAPRNTSACAEKTA